MKSNERIIGCDWLELFVSENPSVDYSPEGFRRRGYEVKEREYGTKTMAQMFKIMDSRGEPFVEIRRDPRGLDKVGVQMVYSRGDSYVRLDNFYCYHPAPMRIMLEFLAANKYAVKKIYRIDIYTDFVRFDKGDWPKDVMRRIVRHQYSKVNQTERRTNGKDTWTECFDNWISWGKKGSMVSTKFYNKTLELKENGMRKPWIVQTWVEHGLIDNSYTLSKDGNPVDVYRVEFSIHGNAKGWVIVGKDESEDGEKHYLPNSPDLYMENKGFANAFGNLVPYYFKFRIYEEGKRKSLCKEKILFKFAPSEFESGYRLVNASDLNRVRRIDVSDELIAANYLTKAYGKLYGSIEGMECQKLLQKVQEKISKKTDTIFAKKEEIF